MGQNVFVHNGVTYSWDPEKRKYVEVKLEPTGALAPQPPSPSLPIPVSQPVPMPVGKAISTLSGPVADPRAPLPGSKVAQNIVLRPIEAAKAAIHGLTGETLPNLYGLASAIAPATGSDLEAAFIEGRDPLKAELETAAAKQPEVAAAAPYVAAAPVVVAALPELAAGGLGGLAARYTVPRIATAALANAAQSALAAPSQAGRVSTLGELVQPTLEGAAFGGLVGPLLAAAKKGKQLELPLEEKPQWRSPRTELGFEDNPEPTAIDILKVPVEKDVNVPYSEDEGFKTASKRGGKKPPSPAPTPAESPVSREEADRLYNEWAREVEKKTGRVIDKKGENPAFTKWKRLNEELARWDELIKNNPEPELIKIYNDKAGKIKRQISDLNEIIHKDTYGLDLSGEKPPEDKRLTLIRGEGKRKGITPKPERDPFAFIDEATSAEKPAEAPAASNDDLELKRLAAKVQSSKWDKISKPKGEALTPRDALDMDLNEPVEPAPVKSESAPVVPPETPEAYIIDELNKKRGEDARAALIAIDPAYADFLEPSPKSPESMQAASGGFFGGKRQETYVGRLEERKIKETLYNTLLSEMSKISEQLKDTDLTPKQRVDLSKKYNLASERSVKLQKEIRQHRSDYPSVDDIKVRWDALNTRYMDAWNKYEALGKQRENWEKIAEDPLADLTKRISASTNLADSKQYSKFAAAKEAFEKIDAELEDYTEKTKAYMNAHPDIDLEIPEGHPFHHERLGKTNISPAALESAGTELYRKQVEEVDIPEATAKREQIVDALAEELHTLPDSELSKRIDDAIESAAEVGQPITRQELLIRIGEKRNAADVLGGGDTLPPTDTGFLGKVRGLIKRKKGGGGEGEGGVGGGGGGPPPSDNGGGFGASSAKDSSWHFQPLEYAEGGSEKISADNIPELADDAGPLPALSRFKRAPKSNTPFTGGGDSPAELQAKLAKFLGAGKKLEPVFDESGGVHYQASDESQYTRGGPPRPIAANERIRKMDLPLIDEPLEKEIVSAEKNISAIMAEIKRVTDEMENPELSDADVKELRQRSLALKRVLREMRIEVAPLKIRHIYEQRPDWLERIDVRNERGNLEFKPRVSIEYDPHSNGLKIADNTELDQGMHKYLIDGDVNPRRVDNNLSMAIYSVDTSRKLPNGKHPRSNMFRGDEILQYLMYFFRAEADGIADFYTETNYERFNEAMRKAMSEGLTIPEALRAGAAGTWSGEQHLSRGFDIKRVTGKPRIVGGKPEVLMQRAYYDVRPKKDK